MESQRAQRGGGRGTGQAGTHYDDVELALIGGVHQLLRSLVIGPFLTERTFGYLGI